MCMGKLWRLIQMILCTGVGVDGGGTEGGGGVIGFMKCLMSV